MFSVVQMNNHNKKAEESKINFAYKLRWFKIPEGF